MNPYGVLVVGVAILLGALGGYATTRTNASLAADPASSSVDAATKPVVPGASDTRVTPVATTETPVPKTTGDTVPAKQAGPEKRTSPKKKTTPKAKSGANQGNSSKELDTKDMRNLAAAYKAFLSAAKSGNPDAIARTLTASHHKPLKERSKWVSGAGMDMYRDFANSVVSTLDTTTHSREKVELRVACKTEIEGTDSQYRKSQKFNRREAFVLLQVENGAWKVSSFREGFQVWKE